jgi:hypothetical protein
MPVGVQRERLGGGLEGHDIMTVAVNGVKVLVRVCRIGECILGLQYHTSDWAKVVLQHTIRDCLPGPARTRDTVTHEIGWIRADGGCYACKKQDTNNGMQTTTV